MKQGLYYIDNKGEVNVPSFIMNSRVDIVGYYSLLQCTYNIIMFILNLIIINFATMYMYVQ